MSTPKRVEIKTSTQQDKKYMALFYNSEDKKIKTTHFGSKGMNDFTLTGDKNARERYRKRHKKDLDTNDFTRAGYLSYFILWGEFQDIKKNISDYKKRFSLG